MLCSISSSLLHKTAFSTFSAKYDIILEDFPSIVKSMVSLDQNITEEMKARDQMTWIGAMNMIRLQAEEIVLEEVIYN